VLQEDDLLALVEDHKKRQADITMSLKQCPVEDLVSRSSVEVDADWRIRQIIEKPTPEQIMSPYAASILFILPPQLWSYLPQIQPSARGEIEMQAAIQMMIEDGFRAFGVLQPAPEEWSLPRHTPPVP
jgi:dTDP-glucose pyrophosphorylase